jgi:hypothetical protein
MQYRYKLFGGDLICFLRDQGGCEWIKLDNMNVGEKPYYLVFEYMYQKYLQNGNVYREIPFGQMLKTRQVFTVLEE